tara:strand:- start:581 stop:961 length:381 start_codon:yes stop_codon:yes gene_type:complete
MAKEELKGIGGWLILPIIGLFISIPVLLYDLLSSNVLYEFNFYIGLLSFLDIILLIWITIGLFSIFDKKKYAPQIMISFYIANIMIQLVLAFLIEDLSGLIYSIIGGAIWIPYFIVSKRVKNTFVR